MNSNLGFGRFLGRSDGSTTSEAWDVLLFLFSGFENLHESKLVTLVERIPLTIVWAFTNLERAEQTLIDTHHGTRIVKLSAVVRCTKQGDELAFGEELVSVLDHLMGTTNEVHVMFLQEAGNHVRTEGEADASIIFTPASDVFVGVRPKEITEQATVRDLQQAVSTHVNTSQEVGAVESSNKKHRLPSKGGLRQLVA